MRNNTPHTRPRQAHGLHSRRLVHGLFLLVLLLVLVLSTFPGLLRAADAEPWNIGVVGPMTGDHAALGRAMVDAVRLRAEQVNAAGGIDGRLVEVVAHDDMNSPEAASLAARKVAEESNALLVIGHRTSGASIAAAPIYQEHKIPAISGTATADELTVNNPWYFRVVYNNRLQADFIANYVNSVLKFKVATLISTDSAYGKSLASAFVSAVDALPLKISNRYELKADNPDMDLEMAGIVSELSWKPDSGIIILAMNAANAAHFVREMRNSGFAFPVFGADAINQQFPSYFEPDAVLKTSPGDFTDQIYATTSMIWDVANEEAVKFRSAFRKRFNRSPDSSMALYYDAASMAMNAIENAGLSGTNLAEDREKIREFLSDIDTPDEAFSGITGKIHFDDSGNAVKTVPVGVFELSEFISAPVQLEPVLNPVMVPDFSNKREAGKIIAFADGYMHATQIVYFGIDLNEISNLNTATGNYTLDFYLWLRYRGDLDLSKIEFSNSVDPIELKNPIWSRERNGMTIQTFKLRGTFHGDFQFKDYPFDTQEVVLEVRHRDRTSESLRFVTDRLGMRLTGPDVTLLQRLGEENVFRTALGWQIIDAEIYQDLIKTASTLGETRFFQGETEVNFSRMRLSMEIARHLASYSTTILLPMFVLFVIGFFLFLVPIEELPPRLSGGILVLVTVSLLRARLSNDLPNIGYLVAIDYIFFALQIIMWFGIMVSVTSFWLLRKNRADLAQGLNRAGAWLYPVPVLLVFIYIWTQIELPPVNWPWL